MKKWTKIASILVYLDLSKWKAETSNNGGDYSFAEFLDVFVCVVDSIAYLRTVVRYSTSAEFSYDELLGKFDNDLNEITFPDADEKYMSIMDTTSTIEEMSSFILYSDLLKLQKKVITESEEVEMWPAVSGELEDSIVSKILGELKDVRFEIKYPELKQSWDLMRKAFYEQGLQVPGYVIDIYESDLDIAIKETSFVLLSKIEGIVQANDLESAFDWISNSPENNPEFWMQVNTAITQ
jgi:hypothetical protein